MITSRAMTVANPPTNPTPVSGNNTATSAPTPSSPALRNWKLRANMFQSTENMTEFYSFLPKSVFPRFNPSIYLLFVFADPLHLCLFGRSPKSN